jgi:hypothetical protein
MQRSCADVNYPYKRKCWTYSGGPLVNSVLWGRDQCEMRGVTKMSNVPNMLRTVVMDVLFCLLICRHLVLNLFLFCFLQPNYNRLWPTYQGNIYEQMFIFCYSIVVSYWLYPRPWRPSPHVKCIPSVRRSIYRKKCSSIKFLLYTGLSQDLLDHEMNTEYEP